MAVRRIKYDETGGGGLNTGDGFGMDNIDNGGSGGGGYSGGSGGSGGGSGVTTNTYVFSIKCNISGAGVKVNGNFLGSAPKELRITKESLAVGPKKIEVIKKSVVAQECYIISMIDDDVPIIDRPNGQSQLGLNQKQIQVQKYKGDTLDGQAKIIQATNQVLNFTLNKAIDDYNPAKKIYSIGLSISGKGKPISVLKNSKKNAEFFPSAGVSEYKDLEGTKYKITASDVDKAIITEIVVTPANGSSEEFKAENDESLEVNLILKDNVQVSITTQEVKNNPPVLNPRISLVNDDPRKYNINEKTGVPLLIKKNKDVQAITLIVGDDILEFDELDDASIIGLTIPSKVFGKIGQYKIKLFPFSFEDYENSIREQNKKQKEEEEVVEKEEEITIIPKEKKKVLPLEKIIIPEEKPEDLFNPYSPVGDPIINDGRNDRLDGRPNNEVRNKDIYR
jgi:hypothetical protein